MTTRMNTRDWEMISAYLDGQLNEKERARLEARLSREPEFQQALEGMQQTRQLLRSRRRLRAPRNFTLTPEMAGVRRRSLPPAVFGLRLTAAFAGLVLVLALIGDFFMRAPAATPVAYSVTSQEAAASQAPENAAVMAATAAPQAALPAAPAAQAPLPTGTPTLSPFGPAMGEPGAATGAGGRGGGTDGGPVGMGGGQPTRGAAALAAPNLEATETAHAVEAMTAAPPGAGAEAPASPPAAAKMAPATATPEASSLAANSAAADTARELEASPTPLPGASQTRQPFTLPNLRGIEIGLAVLVLIAGLGAFLLNRRQS